MPGRGVRVSDRLQCAVQQAELSGTVSELWPLSKQMEVCTWIDFTLLSSGVSV